MRLTDKVAVVTGAASGIGRSVAQVLTREGCKVALVDINEAGLKETLSTLPQDQAFAAPADVSRTEDVRSALDQVVARFGKLTTIANCHGVPMMEDTEIVDVPEDAFDRTIAVNLRGIFLLCKYAVPHLKRAGGGAIVNLASASALRGGTGRQNPARLPPHCRPQSRTRRRATIRRDGDGWSSNGINLSPIRDCR